MRSRCFADRSSGRGSHRLIVPCSLLSHGICHPPLRAVAREPGIASPVLYRYFPSQEDLLTTLIIMPTVCRRSRNSSPRRTRLLLRHIGGSARASHLKGKARVERTMPCVRDSFWSGRQFASIEHTTLRAVCKPSGTATPSTRRAPSRQGRPLHAAPALVVCIEWPLRRTKSVRTYEAPANSPRKPWTSALAPPICPPRSIPWPRRPPR